MAELLVGNDMRLVLQGRGRLKDENGDPVSGATVKATLYEPDYTSDGETEVSGVTWPVILSEGDEEGEYSGVIPADADIQAGKRYYLEIKATTPGNAKGKWRGNVLAENRTM